MSAKIIKFPVRSVSYHCPLDLLIEFQWLCFKMFWGIR